ncbi:methyl jasmonate esterase 1 [Capsicum chacoense]|uniref:methyl jasmonate esterase 1 n=1 Tax=Capsicum annuum TaxID=4072 RepID=UPI001FB13A56|nr:methyl jasmonate esterase 1 [Capsicum annuum]
MVHIMCTFFKRGKKKDMEKSQFLTSLVVLILLLSYANATFSGPKAKKHFVLVHAACHGAWSWYKIIALMRSSGHNVTAIDLGASGINPKQVLDVPRLSDYFMPLTKFLASLPAHEKVVLVGHSFGGYAISKAMESFPEKIAVSVFLTALMPGPNINASTVQAKTLEFTGVASASDNRVAFDNGPTKPPTTFIYGPKYLATKFYQLSPIQDLELANTLVRPLYFYSVEDFSEIILSSKRYGSVRRVFIVAAKDNLLKKKFQKWMIEKNPPDEVEEIQGSDHMTMMSMPQQLYTTLQSIANKYS